MCVCVCSPRTRGWTQNRLDTPAPFHLLPAHAGTTVTDAQTGWAVDFWLDPACPLTRHTARWITQLANEVPIEVNWHVMSLSILNEHRDDDPESDPQGYLWISARVAAAVQTKHGHDALGAFYDALWAEPDGTERQWLVMHSVRRCNAPVCL